MENLIVVSKVKKYLKDKHGLNMSAQFVPLLNQKVHEAINEAIAHAQKSDRKTVMGRDFNLYVHEPEVDEVLVVSSKLKNYIKEKAELSTSKQCAHQLTVRIHKILELSSDKAISDKRKTLMERDYTGPMES